MPERVSSRNQVPYPTYPTPGWPDSTGIIDELLTELVEPNKPGYSVLPPGSLHPNTREFPSHRLLSEEAVEYGLNRRVWCNGYRNQDQYNYDISYSSESNSQPIFSRRYIERRDSYSPLTKESKFTGIYLISVGLTGSGYDPENPPTVTISGGGGSGATARAHVSSLGAIDWIYLTAEGSGYTSQPSVSISSGIATATAKLNLDTGVVYSVTVAAAGTGSGYTTAPTVAFSGGGGSGAQGVAQVSGGKVVNVTVTHYGSGYTSAPAVSFSGGGGTGAAATAVLETATMRLVKEDVQQFPEGDPRRSIWLLVTRTYETLPGPVLIDHDYEPFLDVFTTTQKSVVLSSTVPGDMDYVVQPAGQITEYKSLSKYRSIKLVSKINPNILWENDGEDQVTYGTVPYSFPNEITEDPVYRGILATNGESPASIAMDLELTYDVTEGYSGPCNARFTRRLTVDPLDPDFLAALPPLTVINPQAHVIYGEFGFAGGNLVARVFAFQLPSALHPELEPVLNGSLTPSSFTETIPATEPPTIPRDEWICVSIKPSFSGRFKIWVYDIVEICHPESTLFPPP